MFSFSAVSDTRVAAPDLITDFTRGQDRIDLSGIDANTASAGVQHFHLGRTAGHAGDVVATYDAAHNQTILDLYLNGDATADGRIVLSGHPTLTASDFIFS